MPERYPPVAATGQRMSLANAVALAAHHQGEGRLLEAERVLREILKAAPRHAPALHLLGIIAHQSGQTETAVRLIREAIDQQPGAGLYHTNLCEILRQDGQLESAIEHGRRGAVCDPGSANAHSNLGVAYYDHEDYDNAEQCQRRALGLAPNLPQALNNLGSICRQREQPEAAIAFYRQALAVAPNHHEALNNLGALLTEMEQPEEARDVLLHAIRLKPNYAEAHRNIGSMFLQQEMWDKAEIAFSTALRHRPQFVEAMIGLAAVRRENNQLAEAERTLNEALALDPDKASTLSQLGMLYSDQGFPARALEAFDRAISADPKAETSYVTRSHVLLEMGDMAGAEEALNTALAIKADSVGARLALVHLKKVSPDDGALEAMEAEIASLAETSVTRRIPLNFGLGKCYDDLGSPERAMQHYLEGCRLKRTRVSYDAEQNTRHIDEIIATFDAATCTRLAAGGEASELPVFVLGMPRSGTTLTEQIIASHSATHGAGELPDLLQLAALSPLTGARVGYPQALANLTAHELIAMGAKYVAGLRQRHPTASRITDKMPANFHCVGLIHLMLPRARIIHVKRNALDTCLSNITKLFKNGQGHSYNLTELGRYYRDYARLMAHWRAVLPAGAWFEIQYEDLVADTEPHARQLIEYCGLTWEPECLEFHKTERSIRTASVTQVRQPIYKTSVARWKRYEKSLGPLLDALGDVAEA